MIAEMKDKVEGLKGMVKYLYHKMTKKEEREKTRN